MEKIIMASFSLPEISELGAAIHDVSLVVPQLRPVVLVITSSESHQGPVLNITQTDNLTRTESKSGQN